VFYVRPKGEGKGKRRITIHATIRDDGRKPPLIFIAKGKTTIVENNLIDDPEGNWKPHSVNRWQTEFAFKEYLTLLPNYKVFLHARI
jgi:hypothetical protein